MGGGRSCFRRGGQRYRRTAKDGYRNTPSEVCLHGCRRGSLDYWDACPAGRAIGCQGRCYSLRGRIRSGRCRIYLGWGAIHFWPGPSRRRTPANSLEEQLMNKWKNITLFKFQQIEAINASLEYDDLNKVLFSACVVFDMTEHQLDTGGIKKAGKIVAKVKRIFSSEFRPITSRRIGRYTLQYDVSALTFGQYIELSFFLQGSV